MAETPKYSFEEAQEWSRKKGEEQTKSKTILYIFGALAVLLIFAALLAFFMADDTPAKKDLPPIAPPKEDSSESTSYEDSESQTDSATSITERDILNDIKNSKRTIKAKAS